MSAWFCTDLWSSGLLNTEAVYVFLTLGKGIAVSMFISFFVLFFLLEIFYSQESKSAFCGISGESWEGLNVDKSVMVESFWEGLFMTPSFKSLVSKTCFSLISVFNYGIGEMWPYKIFTISIPTFGLVFFEEGSFKDMAKGYQKVFDFMSSEYICGVTAFQWGWEVDAFLSIKGLFTMVGLPTNEGVQWSLGFSSDNNSFEGMSGSSLFKVCSYPSLGKVFSPWTHWGGIENYVNVPIVSKTSLFLLSKDVMHGFSCPSLSFKLDVVPGSMNFGVLEGNVLGGSTYKNNLVICSEYCGAHHSHMSFDLCCVFDSDLFMFSSDSLVCGLESTSAVDFKVLKVISLHKSGMSGKSPSTMGLNWSSSLSGGGMVGSFFIKNNLMNKDHCLMISGNKPAKSVVYTNLLLGSNKFLSGWKKIKVLFTKSMCEKSYFNYQQSLGISELIILGLKEKAIKMKAPSMGMLETPMDYDYSSLKESIVCTSKDLLGLKCSEKICYTYGFTGFKKLTTISDFDSFNKIILEGGSYVFNSSSLFLNYFDLYNNNTYKYSSSIKSLIKNSIDSEGDEAFIEFVSGINSV